MSEIKYYSVEFPRKKAIVTYNTHEKTVNAVHCSNSVFCNRFKLELENCPQFCEVIAEVKKFFRGRKPRPVVYEVKKEELNREAGLVESLTPLQADQPVKM